MDVYTPTQQDYDRAWQHFVSHFFRKGYDDCNNLVERNSQVDSNPYLQEVYDEGYDLRIHDN